VCECWLIWAPGSMQQPSVRLSPSVSVGENKANAPQQKKSLLLNFNSLQLYQDKNNSNI